MFRLYSMTKVIVCTAGMIQFERGKFALDEPYSDYFPEFKDTQVVEKDASGAWKLRKASRPIRIKDFTNTYLDGYGYGLGVRTLLSQAGVSNSTPGEFGWTGAAGTWTSIDPAHKFSVVYMQNMFPNNEEYHHMRVRAVAYGML